MSLNKFRDASVKKEWMNINCNDLKTTTFEAEAVTTDQITVRGDVLPQARFGALTGTNSTLVSLDGGVQQILSFLNGTGTQTGRITSSDTDNSFKINPETRLTVDVEGPVAFRKLAVAPAILADHVAVYAKTGSTDLWRKTETGDDKQLATYVYGTSTLNIALIAGGVNFNQPNPSSYSVIGNHVSIWGVFRLDANVSIVDIALDEVPSYPPVATTILGTLSGHKEGVGAGSFATVDTTYSLGVFQMLFGTVNDFTIVPANNVNTLFHYRIDYHTA